MINAQEIRKQAIQMFMDGLGDKNYAYFYGAKGQKLTDDVMNALWAAEPGYFSKYTTAQKKAIFDYSRGKIGFDCSGYVCQVLRNAGSSQPNLYSTALYEKCNNKTDLSQVKCGGLLYFSKANGARHIGIDIGNGFCLSACSEGSGIKLQKTRQAYSGWTIKGGEHPDFDYSRCTND